MQLFLSLPTTAINHSSTHLLIQPPLSPPLPPEPMTGTFKRALKEDARIWNFVLYGHHEVWPVKASVGGQPGRTGMALHPVTPKVRIHYM